jgi:FAD synthetase
MAKTAGIIVIGNEILSGRTPDENSIYLLRELRSLGVDVRRVSVIPDEVTAIRDEVGTFSAQFDYVFTSGGVGPTHDDVTIAGIADAFNQGIRREPTLVVALERYYQDALTEVMLRMANVPEEAVLVQSEETLFPVVAVRNVYIFPGVPEILRSKFDRIKELFRQTPYHVLDVYLQVEEGEIANTLDEVLEAFPDLGLGSYPSLNNPVYKVKLTLESKDQEFLDQARRCLIEKLASRSIIPVAPPHPR